MYEMYEKSVYIHCYSYFYYFVFLEFVFHMLISVCNNENRRCLGGKSSIFLVRLNFADASHGINFLVGYFILRLLMPFF